jgi:dTDP-4-dehydrorhamnose reductase
MNAGPNILITGGGGMLAQAFAKVFAQRERPATLLSRLECDIVNHRALERAFEEHRPTVVINCAAYTKVDQAEKEPALADAVNGLGPSLLAVMCKRYDAALMHFSTDYVFDGTIDRPLRPDDPVGPQSAYGKSKLLGEQAIQQMPPARWIIVRTAWLYGAGGPNFVQTMVNVARAGKPLRVVNDQVGSPTYTIDLAQAALGLLDAGASGIWHVSNSGQTTWHDFAAAIFEQFNPQPSLAPISSDEWKSTRPESAVRPRYSVLDVEPVEKLLGQPMRPWREALRAFQAEVDVRAGF